MVLLLFEDDTLFKGDDNPHLKATSFDLDKVKTTIKQVYRDWSKAGKEERDACYLPVLSAVERRFPPDTQSVVVVVVVVVLEVIMVTFVVVVVKK